MNKRNETVKKSVKNVNINKKELIVTIIVIICVIFIGFTIGKFLFEALYGQV